MVPGELALAFEDFGAHAGMDFEEAGEVGGGGFGLFQDMFEHADAGEFGEVDGVAFGFVGFDEFDEGFEVLGLIEGELIDLHEAVDHVDGVVVVDVVADGHGGHQSNERVEVSGQRHGFAGRQFEGHGYSFQVFLSYWAWVRTHRILISCR